jgi:hypothetical protein
MEKLPYRNYERIVDCMACGETVVTRNQSNRVYCPDCRRAVEKLRVLNRGRARVGKPPLTGDELTGDLLRLVGYDPNNHGCDTCRHLRTCRAVVFSGGPLPCEAEATIPVYIQVENVFDRVNA